MTQDKILCISYVLSVSCFVLVILFSAYRYVKYGVYFYMEDKDTDAYTGIFRILGLSGIIACVSFLVSVMILSFIQLVFVQHETVAITIGLLAIFLIVVFFTARQLRKPNALIKKLKE